MSAMPAEYDRDVLVDVLVYHYRVAPGKGCGCGWSKLGLSWADHVADVYEESVALRTPACGLCADIRRDWPGFSPDGLRRLHVSHGHEARNA